MLNDLRDANRKRFLLSIFFRTVRRGLLFSPQPESAKTPKTIGIANRLIACFMNDSSSPL